MLTHTSGRNLFGTFTSDTSAANLTVGDTLINEAIREVITLKPWGFRQKTKTFSTATSNSHPLPADFGRVLNVTITIGSTKYTPRQIKTREDWDRLTQSTNTTSNTPEFYFVFGKTLAFYPAPSSATASAGTVAYMREHKDLSIADYTTGTITTIASAGTTVTGSSTSWTSQMTGRYIRITDSNAANTGDGYWYEIASVTSTTILELVAPYNGTSISVGSATYAIGQTSIIPEDFQLIPIHRAVENYFTYIQPDDVRSAKAKQNYSEGVKRMNIELGAVGV